VRASAQIGADLGEYAAKHVGRQYARVRVVARAMIAVVKPEPAGFVNGAMGKGHRRGAQSKRLDSCFMGDAAERHDGAEPRHALDGRQKKRPAIGDFRRKRFVLGRDAVHAIGDAAINQHHAVVRPGLIGAGGETIFDQSGVEQVACVIAGEGAPGAIGALQARREPDDREPSVPVAESRNRCVEPLRFLHAVGLAKSDQPWTEGAVAVGLG
jgi:hypothetical protein